MPRQDVFHRFKREHVNKIASTRRLLMRTLGAIWILFILLPVVHGGQARQLRYSIRANPAKGDIVITRDGKPIIEVDSIQFNFNTPSRMTVVERSEQRIVLDLLYRDVWDPEKVNTKTDYTVEVKIDRIDRGWHIHAHPEWARDVSIYLKDLGGRYFGIRENLVPDNRKSPDITGSVQSFDVKGEDSRYHENYASAWSALFMNTLGYASFFDTFAEGEYQFGMNGNTEIYHRTGVLDWYIFTGRNGDEIMRSYYGVVGTPKYVPAWACGPTIWRDQDWNGKEDILNDAREMAKLKIPFTSMMVDRPYSDGVNGWSKMNFGKGFEQPGEWIHELNSDYNVKFMSWVAPCTFGDTGTVKPMPGDHGYIDLSNPARVTAFDDALTRNIYYFGVQGNKMDRADEAFPVEQAWHDRTPPWERRNRYIYLYAKVIDSVLTAKWGKDNFNYSRSGIQGSQKYLSALWGGDSRASWDGLACSVANAVRVGFIGFPDWGSDVGGYLGNAGMEPEELYSRWLQFGTWSGLMEVKLDGAGGRGEDRAPWHYGKSLQDKFRLACKERMTLVPYVYSHFNTSAVNGVLMKPLAYSFPDDGSTYHIWNEYLFGHSFLVAPVTEPGKTAVRIYLPEGGWYDWHNPAKRYTGGREIEYRLSEDDIPVFVKENAIFVTGEDWLKGNSIKWKSETNPGIIVNVFPGKKDFSNQFTYVDRFSGDSLKEITVSQKKGRISIYVPGLGCDVKVLVYNVTPSGRVKVNGGSGEYKTDGDKRTIEIAISKYERGEVVIER